MMGISVLPCGGVVSGLRLRYRGVGRIVIGAARHAIVPRVAAVALARAAQRRAGGHHPRIGRYRVYLHLRQLVLLVRLVVELAELRSGGSETFLRLHVRE